MDKNTTEKFIKNDITQKKSKYWEMHYYWLLEQNTKKRFIFLWKQSSDNLVDYHTKHFSPTYHKKVLMKYVRDYNPTK